MKPLQPYKSYKSEKLSWIQTIPSHWNARRAKFLFNLEKRPPRDSDGIVTAFRDGEVTLRSNRRTDGFTNSFKEIGYQGVRKGDLVIHAMDAFAGAIGVSDSDGKSTPVYSCLTARDGAYIPYYAAMLRSMALSGFIQSLAKGIRERSTDFRWGEISELSLPVPPMSEQDLIANYLGRETARIDTLIAKKTRFIELLKEKRQAVITKAVTKGLDDSAEMKDSRVDWIGVVPSSWEVKQLKWSVLDCSNGIWGNDPDGVLDIIVVRVADFDRHHREVSLDRPTLRSIDKSARAGRLLKRGDLLIEKSGGGDNQPVGMVVTYEYDELAVCSNFVAKMTPREGYHSAFLKYLHQAFYCTGLHIRSIKQSTGIQNLDSKAYLDEYAAFPSLHEQKEIANWLDKSCSRIDGLIFKTERSIELLKEHRAALITAAVTGKIDVREAT